MTVAISLACDADDCDAKTLVEPTVGAYAELEVGALDSTSFLVESSSLSIPQRWTVEDGGRVLCPDHSE